jgi:hypothetical protein
MGEEVIGDSIMRIVGIMSRYVLFGGMGVILSLELTI